MKTTDIGLFISSAFGSILLSLAPATAAILVEPIINTADENFPDGPGFAPFLPLEKSIFNAPDKNTQRNFLNDTGYTINSFSIQLLRDFSKVDDDVVWGDVNGDGKIGLSNIFANITTTSDSIFEGFPAPKLELKDGIIASGQRFTFQFITSPDLNPINPEENGPLVLVFDYDGVKVPEPSNVFGFILTMALFGWLKNKKLTRI